MHPTRGVHLFSIPQSFFSKDKAFCIRGDFIKLLGYFFQRQLRTNDLCINEDSLKTINISVN